MIFRFPVVDMLVGGYHPGSLYDQPKQCTIFEAELSRLSYHLHGPAANSISGEKRRRPQWELRRVLLEVLGFVIGSGAC